MFEFLSLFSFILRVFVIIVLLSRHAIMLIRAQILTANCRRLVSLDHSATNGVIHLVDHLLEPVTSSVADVIRRTPHLSQFAQRQFQH